MQAVKGKGGRAAEEFGLVRVRNTPITEAGFVGAAAGAAMVGIRIIVDMMIAPVPLPRKPGEVDDGQLTT